jgi:endoglycosylceramidase
LIRREEEMMNRISLLIFMVALAACGTAQTAARHARSASEQGGFITAGDSVFLDGAGRPIRFQGINIAKKSKSEGYTGDLGPRDFARIRGWGMNAVRLCIFWDGLEPRPGVFDEVYLGRIARLVGYAKAQGLYVLLDMHQDLYSVKFGDGAPAWATLDDGKPHTTVSNWNDAYYVSADVQAALDHFWANSSAPDGVGLQDHYAKAWQFVARRFKDEPAVFGYDLMNEPFPGQDAGRLEYTMLARVAEVLAARPGVPHPSVEELMKMEGSAEGFRQIAVWLGDVSLYRSMLDAGKSVMEDFDHNRLMPMYGRVRKAIRAVDSRHILFLESAMSSNMGVETSIAPLMDESGRRDPQQAYSPHVYDIVVDTDLFALTSNERTALIIDRDQSFAAQYHLPVLVGEWGAFYLNPKAAEATRDLKGRFSRAGFSDMFWAYRREMTKWAGLEALKVASDTH